MNLGVYETMDAAVYHADPCDTPSLSSGVAKIISERSPQHAWLAHPRLNPNYVNATSDSFDLGTAAHALLLEGNDAKICVIDPNDYPSKTGSIPDGWTNNAIRAARDEARENGLTPVLVSQNVALTRMVEAARKFISDSPIAKAFANGKPELSILFKDGSTVCRARLDKYDQETATLIDYKTTDDVSPRAFARTAISLRYYMQAAFYARSVNAVGLPFANFVFFAQSIYPPHDCTLHVLSPDMEAIADAEVQRAMDSWQTCIESGRWPGYGSKLNWIESPPWLLARAEEMGVK
jgi:hypothetical protein